jgi:tetratricopeptide (TPR) repeat protein/transcriptional regulator with XRE-family HTH domain
VAEQAGLSFAVLLRRLRAEVRLTQEELAEAAGVSYRTVSDLERGLNQTARKDTAGLLAGALGLAGPARAVFIAAARGRASPGEVRAARAAQPSAGAAAVWAGGPAVAAGGWVVPRELPADVAGFTGREGELSALDRLLPEVAGDGPAGRPVVISAVAGTAGVGKTALAVRWAHRVAGSFPDGQLYVNLRGYDPGQPVPPAEALAGLLRGLGVAEAVIPLGEADRAARLRSLVAGKRLLLVLDNAGSVAQVRPLLPGSPSVMVVVTSRDALAGLVAREGAIRLPVDLLPSAAAVALLDGLIGARAAADPAAVAALAAQCAYLPLALRVAAELAIARPGTPLAELTAELADVGDRLALLDAGGDTEAAVASVFSCSYQQLAPSAARLFRLLGLHPAQDFDPWAAAALAGVDLPRARQLIGTLARAHLLQPAAGGRYQMHDLLRAYAAQQTARHDSRPARRAALTRLFDYYLAATAAALDTLAPAERQRRPDPPRAAAAVPGLSDPAAAVAWLDAELATLAAVAAHAAAHGWPGHTTRLAATLFRYLNQGHALQSLTINGCALNAAQASGDRAAQARALTDLASAHHQRGNHQQALDCYRQALDLARDLDDRRTLARATANLGRLHFELGRYGEASDCYQQSRDLFRALGDRPGEADSLGNLAEIYHRQGRDSEAIELLHQAQVLNQDLDDHYGVAAGLISLGEISRQQGQHQQAEDYLLRVLQVSRQIGARVYEAEALTRLADLYGQLRRTGEAGAHYQQALTLCQQAGHRNGEADALIGTGHLLLSAGQITQAQASLTTALTLARQIQDPYQQARALHGLAAACHAAGQPGQARRYDQQARGIYTTLGITPPAPPATHPEGYQPSGGPA